MLATGTCGWYANGSSRSSGPDCNWRCRLTHSPKPASTFRYTTGETGRKVPVPAIVTVNGSCCRATSRTWLRVASQSCVMVVVTSVMCAGTTAAMGSPNDARQRWSSSAMSAGKLRITPMLMPSLRCPSDVAAFAVTLLTEDIDLADSLGAGVGQETYLGVDVAQ